MESKAADFRFWRQIMATLRGDYNAKVEEVLSLRDDVMLLQVAGRQREELLAIKTAEVDALHKQVASLRDYVVSQGSNVAL